MTPEPAYTPAPNELAVLYEKDCGRYGKIRVTEATITIGRRTFPRAVLMDFEIRPPRLLSWDTLWVLAALAGTGLWLLVFLALLMHTPVKADGAGPQHPDPGLGTILATSGVMLAVLAICAYFVRRWRWLYWLTVRTTRGERYRTRFVGPDPQLEAVFESLLAVLPPGWPPSAGSLGPAYSVHGGRIARRR